MGGKRLGSMKNTVYVALYFFSDVLLSDRLLC